MHGVMVTAWSNSVAMSAADQIYDFDCEKLVEHLEKNNFKPEVCQVFEG